MNIYFKIITIIVFLPLTILFAILTYGFLFVWDLNIAALVPFVLTLLYLGTVLTLLTGD